MSSLISKTDLAVTGSLLDALPPVIRAIRAAMRDAEGGALTVPQFRVLGFVSLAPCTNKQLAEWQGVSLAAMSRMVGMLVRRKLLLRVPDPRDRRQAQLRLSKQGEHVFQRLRETIEQRLAERVAPLSEDKKKALRTGLSALEEVFGDIS